MTNLKTAYQGKKVFITGDSGFKGTWLSEYLHLLGAEVVGYSLPQNDIMEAEKLQQAMASERFDFYFHLAAQSQVGIGYSVPKHTYLVNVMGTLHFLQALRHINWPYAAVIVTTDKVYRQNGDNAPFHENDPLGGHDPYSSSKACAEILTQSWLKSYLQGKAIATARSGNAIGGGDYNLGRIVPNFFDCLSRGVPVSIFTNSVRPWLHVLDVVEGYLALGAELPILSVLSPEKSAFNFGPAASEAYTVKQLVEGLATLTGGSYEETQPNFFEEPCIKLSSTRAAVDLDWKPRLDFAAAVYLTAQWYRQPSIETTIAQIKAHANL